MPDPKPKSFLPPAGSKPKNRPAPAVYSPVAGSILQGQLRKVAQYGTPKQFLEVKQKAEGKDVPIWKRGLEGAALVFGAPARAVEAPLAAALFSGQRYAHPDTMSFGRKLIDPSYGAGYEINRIFPDANPWAKTGIGLAADVALDPLTYMSFGASGALKAVGRGKGLQAAFLGASEAAETAEEAARLTKLAAQAGKGAHTLPEAALREAEQLLGHESGAFSFGAHFKVPGLPHDPVPIATEGLAGELGRKLEAIGPAISGKLGETRVGEALGGNLAKMKRWVGSGDPEKARAGLRIIQGEARARKLESYAVHAMAAERAPLEAELRRLGINTPEEIAKFNEAMGSRPLAARNPEADPILHGATWEDVPTPDAEYTGGNTTRRLIGADGQELGRVQFGTASAAEGGQPDMHKVFNITVSEEARRKGVGMHLLDSLAQENAHGRAGLSLGTPTSVEGQALWDSMRSGAKEDPGALLHQTDARGVERRIYPADQGGPAWQEFVSQSPRHHELASEWADMIARRRDWAHDVSRYRDQGIEFLADAEEGGRPYMPRVPSDKMAEEFGYKPKSPNDPAKRAFMEQGGIAPGTEGGARFEKQTGEKLYTPGETIEEGKYAGEVAPSLEAQYERVMKDIHGEDYIPAWETDVFKANEIYERGLAKAIAKYHLSNYLVEHGIARHLPGGSIAKALMAEGRSKWRDDLFAGWENGQLTTVQGKTVSNPAVQVMNNIIDRNEDTLAPIVEQFVMVHGQYHEAATQLEMALADYHALPRNKAGEIAFQNRPGVVEKIVAYEEAKALYTLRDSERLAANAAAQQVAHLGAQNEMLRGALADWKSADWETIMKDHQAVAKAMHQAMSQGWEGFGFNRQAPDFVIEALKDINRSYDPITGDGLMKYMPMYDNLLHWTKGWLTTSPGFIQRNIFGGMFNNWLANVNILKSGKQWGTILLKSAPLKGGKAAEQLGNHESLLYRVADRLGIIGSGQFSSELGQELGHVSKFNPLAGIAGGDKTFALPYWSKRLNEQFVEPWLRGTLYHDRMVKAMEMGRFETLGIKGGKGKWIESLNNMTPEDLDKVVKQVADSSIADEILGEVDKYHFNYDDLSKVERQGVKRIIPFYTWTRKNIPLQIEAMFTQPGKAINRYMAVKRNMETGSAPEGVVPMWMQQQGFIRLPWKSKGNQLYGTVDLPFKDPFKLIDPGSQITGMVNPLIKTPVELMTGRKFFNQVPLTGEYKPMPGAWAKFPGFTQALSLADKMPFLPVHAPQKDAQGNWMMRDTDAYLFDQFMPWMYQIQRLLPFWDAKDKGRPSKESARLTSSAISYLAGIALRTNTPQDIEGEIYRRIGNIDPQMKDMKALGQIPTRPTRPRRATNLTDLLATVGPATEGYSAAG